MRTEKDIFDLIISIAKDDELLRAAIMTGSRANPDSPKDKYQDYDIAYIVKSKNDIKPYYNNTGWIERHFGKPLITQLPENMELIPPDGDGHFTALMLFNDGVRIDLTIDDNYIDDGQYIYVIFDKDNRFHSMKPDDKHWRIKPPNSKYFYDCCNEFWWCLNNVAKGIARDELPYAMNMYNCIVKDMLDKMIEWFIGVSYDFSVSSGKNGKYFKKYLPVDLYEKYKKTYSDSDYDNFWDSISRACELFHFSAEKVASYLNVSYNQNEENGMNKYLEMVKNDYNKR